jgi:hypothetical protein
MTDNALISTLGVLKGPVKKWLLNFSKKHNVKTLMLVVDHEKDESLPMEEIISVRVFTEDLNKAIDQITQLSQENAQLKKANAQLQKRLQK